MSGPYLERFPVVRCTTFGVTSLGGGTEPSSTRSSPEAFVGLSSEQVPYEAVLATMAASGYLLLRAA